MNRRQMAFLGIVVAWIGVRGIASCVFPKSQATQPKITYVDRAGDTLMLPPPSSESETSLERALLERRSIRTYQAGPLTLAEVSQLLWAAQGITHSDGYRTAPSAGALYPLELYLVAGNVQDLAAGLYHYEPRQHRLAFVTLGDFRAGLSAAALGQASMEHAAAVIVMTAVMPRTTTRYGERGIRYVHMEVGSAAQNVYLQAVSLGLGTVFVGAFDDDEVRQILDLPEAEDPLALQPLGRLVA